MKRPPKPPPPPPPPRRKKPDISKVALSLETQEQEARIGLLVALTNLAERIDIAIEQEREG